MPDWNDFRMVLAIARAGGLMRAAEALGVNHSTVFRRLNGLEEQLGVQLFERLPGGYEPTDAGAQLVAAAERIESETLALDRDLAGRDARLCGRLRVTSSETLAFRILTPEIVRFRAAHPGIQLLAVKVGIGLAVLPCYLADPEPDLRRALTPIPELTRELWLVTHEALKGTARVRAFMEIVGEGVRRRLAALEPHPQATPAAPVPAPAEPVKAEPKAAPPRAR